MELFPEMLKVPTEPGPPVPLIQGARVSVAAGAKDSGEMGHRRKRTRCRWPVNPGERRGDESAGIRSPNITSPLVQPCLLTIVQAADQLACCERFVRKLIRSGELRVFKPSPKIVRIHRSSIEQFIAECSSGGHAAA